MRRFAWLPCLALVTGTPTVAQERPAPAIRIATYNAYLLSPIFKCLHVNFADCLLQTEGKTEEWANHLADTILADTDRFDIIVPNEAWDEDAKDIWRRGSVPATRSWSRRSELDYVLRRRLNAPVADP